MSRPTPARLADLRRTGGWPFLSWCFAEQHLRPDLDLLLAKLPGDLYQDWTVLHDGDVTRIVEVARRFGWSTNWARDVCTSWPMLTCPGGRARCSLSATPSNGFTSSDVGYLEGRLFAELDAISGIAVVKGKTDGDATLPPHMQMSLDSLLSSILAAVRLAGVDTHREDEDEQPPSAVSRTQIPGTVAELLAEGLLHAGAELHCTRAGKHGVGTVAPDGQIIVNGVGHTAPSLAAAISLGATSSAGYGGWEIGHVDSIAGPKLADLRSQLPQTKNG